MSAGHFKAKASFKLDWDLQHVFLVFLIMLFGFAVQCGTSSCDSLQVWPGLCHDRWARWLDRSDDQTYHHIVRVHQKHEEALSPSFTTAQIQCYIAYVKTLKPKVVSLSHFELVFQFPKELLGFFSSFQEPLTLLFTIDCLMPWLVIMLELSIARYWSQKGSSWCICILTARWCCTW